MPVTGSTGKKVMEMRSH